MSTEICKVFIQTLVCKLKSIKLSEIKISIFIKKMVNVKILTNAFTSKFTGNSKRCFTGI